MSDRAKKKKRLPIRSKPRKIACTAYTRYILDVGASSDWLALQVALGPCLLGYGAIAARLHVDPATKREGNRYWKWIENYVEEDYVQAVATGRGEFVSLFPFPLLLESSPFLQPPLLFSSKSGNCCAHFQERGFLFAQSTD